MSQPTAKQKSASADAKKYPFPPSRGGNLFDKIRQLRAAHRDILIYMMDAPRLLGDISYFQIGNNHSYIVTHPDHIREILVSQADIFERAAPSVKLLRLITGNGLFTSSGEFWRRQRKLMQPAFHHKRIASYAQIMADRTLNLLARWQTGQTRDIDVDMMTLTLEIATDTLFGVEMGDEARQVGQAVEEAQRAIIALSRMFFPVPDWLPIPANRRVQRAVNTLDRILLPMIQQRRASAGDGDDLLSMLLLAAEEDGTGRMSDQQIRDEAMTIFIAGHETTANALTWAWYLLSENPVVKEKLCREVDGVLRGNPPGLETLPQLVYTEMIIKEAMRLYPPAWIISREPQRDTVVGGYRIIKGGFVMICPYVTHRDPRFFESPEEFIPERFEPEKMKNLPRDAYLPFGDGPRVCIGNVFAMMEAKIILAAIAQQFDLTLTPGHPVEAEPLIALRPRYGMKMDIQKRGKN